jgi:hypothetical protein
VKKWDKKLWGGDSELSGTLHLCTINPICFGKQQNSVKRNKLIKFKAGKGRSQNGVSACCRRALYKEELLLLLVFFLSPGHFLKLHSHTHCCSGAQYARCRRVTRLDQKYAYYTQIRNANSATRAAKFGLSFFHQIYDLALDGGGGGVIRLKAA